MSSLAPSIVEMNNAAYMTAIANQRERIASLEAELTEQARIVGMGAERELALIAERDQLRAEVERLRPNARRYEWLTEDHPKQETRVWVHQIAMTFNTRGRGHIDAAIDRAIEAAKEA